MSPGSSPLLQPVTAGVVTGLVGFTGAFVVVLTGLTAAGADRDQAASGLLAVSVTMGLASVLLAWRTRLPITIAWSTPGAALLVTTGTVDGGWPDAVGAFIITGALILLTGVVPALGSLIARIPPSLAQAMLAGVLLQICLGPITGLAQNPLAVAPVVLVWLIALRFWPRWSSPLALLTAIAVIWCGLASSGVIFDPALLAPKLVFTAPQFNLAATIGIALPLYLVTMASQNVPGVAVLAGLGYRLPWRASMLVTGAGTVLGAPAGGHAINLAAISAALAAGPEAGADKSRRWLASVTSGVVVIGLGVCSAALATLVSLAPVGVIAAVAGLALLATFASSVRAALAEPAEQIPAAVTLLTAASGIAVLGVSAAFWALLAGLLTRAVLQLRRRRGTIET